MIWKKNENDKNAWTIKINQILLVLVKNMNAVTSKRRKHAIMEKKITKNIQNKATKMTQMKN